MKISHKIINTCEALDVGTCCANTQKKYMKIKWSIIVPKNHYSAPRVLLKTLLCDTCCVIISEVRNIHLCNMCTRCFPWI